MKKQSVDNSKLKTVKNYATERLITPQYIHKLVSEQKMEFYIIDGVKFIQEDVYPEIPVINRRK